MRALLLMLLLPVAAGARQQDLSWGPSLYGPRKLPEAAVPAPPVQPVAPPASPAAPKAVPRVPKDTRIKPRRPGARQEIVTMPPPPPPVVVRLPDLVDPGLPQAPGVPPPPLPANCSPAGCATPNGQLPPAGPVSIDAQGRTCVRNGPVIQCF
ncbi:MAG: hypothetical protein ACXU8N_00680 [Telluria sp.]